MLVLTFFDSFVTFFVSPWDWAKLVSSWEQNLLYTKSQQMLHRKWLSMLTDLKVSSLACKCVFNRPKHNLKGEPHGIEF